MTCDELRPEYGAYALGIAENPERAEISEHLAADCPVCGPEVKGAIRTVTAMAMAVKLAEPPKRLRRRVIAMVAPEKERRRLAVLAPWATAAVLALVLLSVQFSRVRPNPASRLEQALTILDDPSTKDVSFGEPTARGRVFVSPAKGVVFIAAHLPPLGAHRTFELWVIPAAGNPIPAGTFLSDPDASAVYVRPGPVTNAAAMAVTIEPEGGSPQPTTTPFIVTKL